MQRFVDRRVFHNPINNDVSERFCLRNRLVRGQLGRYPLVDGLKRRIELTRILSTRLSEVGSSTSASTDLLRDEVGKIARFDSFSFLLRHAGDQNNLIVRIN